MERTHKGVKKLTTTASLDPLPPSTKAKTDDDGPSLTLTPVMPGVAWVMITYRLYERRPILPLAPLGPVTNKSPVNYVGWIFFRPLVGQK